MPGTENSGANYETISNIWCKWRARGQTTVFNAIGLGLMGISMIPPADSFFPKVEPKYSTLRVAAGLSQPLASSASTGGSVPGVALFDANGNRVGFQSGHSHGTIDEGNCKDIQIAPIESQYTINPEYMSVVTCGAPWYHSNLAIQINGETYKPSCFWIGGHRQDTGRPTNSFPMGIGLHIIDFDGNEARQAQYIEHPETLCESKPRLHMYDQLSEMTCLPIFDPPLKNEYGRGDADFEKLYTQRKVMCEPSANGIDPFPTTEQIMKLQKWTLGRFSTALYGTKRRSLADAVAAGNCTHTDDLIECSHPQRMATELCHDPNAVGPEFVSHSEGLMCDMCTRTLWPLCGANVKEECFDVETKQVRRQDLAGQRGETIAVHTKIAAAPARAYLKTVKCV
ncbi:uncharacterized protein BDW70DRAFT_150500 [Aspergillus foveolatus]|uniref:uncharacterized protein n=1 Tax=Aspergillus foveolatus TaxID=210207 RepID=UPI003CCDA533